MPDRLSGLTRLARLPFALAYLVSAVGALVAAGPTLGATAPGTVIKKAPLPSALGALSMSSLLTVTTRDSADRPRVITASLFVPRSPWQGPGRRPLIGMAVGSYGQGDKCAPSLAFTAPVSLENQQVGYEVSSVAQLLARGYAVVVPDYLGMRSPGAHTYLNRIEQGRATIDAVRGARSTGMTGSVGFWGYSQGGGASGAAAELQPDYAPELPLRAVYAGAPPGDLAATFRNRGNIMALLIVGWAANSALATDPDLRAPINAVLNPAGKTFLRRVAGMCLPDGAAHYGLSAPRLTVDGRALGDALLAIPGFARWTHEQRLGRVAPRAPVLVHSGRNDDVVPFADQARLVEAWRTHDARVNHLILELPPTAPGFGMDHSYPHQLDNERAITWLDRTMRR